MVYTVKKISVLSGVSVRTLHFYEEAGLLKPAYYGSNGYRYYEEKELLQLQQILFFKELGFTLKQIKKVLGRSDFDQLSALYSHKQSLTHEWKKIELLLKTIDKTINHLKGKKKMKDKEIYYGFNLVKRGKGNEPYFTSELIVLGSIRNPTIEKQEDSFYENIDKRANDLFRKIKSSMEKGLQPTSSEVQLIIKAHHAFIDEFSLATIEVYKAYAQLYREHPDFRKQLDPIHPKLGEFMAKAMIWFADNTL